MVSTLAGKYLEVEHDAIYKPEHGCSDIKEDELIKEARALAFAGLIHFETVFEQVLADYERAAAEAPNAGETLP